MPKVATWTAEVTSLASVASTRPHAAYSTFTHGMVGHWMYVMRTIPGINPLFKPPEDAINFETYYLSYWSFLLYMSCFLFLVVWVVWVLLTQLLL